MLDNPTPKLQMSSAEVTEYRAKGYDYQPLYGTYATSYTVTFDGYRIGTTDTAAAAVEMMKRHESGK